MLSLPVPEHMPCERCGASLARDEATAHECDRERVLDFRLVQLCEEIESFDALLAAWLVSPNGRFEQLYAERTRPS